MSFFHLQSPRFNNVLDSPRSPTVIDTAATNILSTQADGNGNVLFDNGSAITERGFVWDTNPNPTTSNNKLVVSGTVGSFTGTMTGLTSGTTYHYRAYAINAYGTSYGSDMSFTTSGSVVTAFSSTLLLMGVA